MATQSPIDPIPDFSLSTSPQYACMGTVRSKSFNSKSLPLGIGRDERLSSRRLPINNSLLRPTDDIEVSSVVVVVHGFIQSYTFFSYLTEHCKLFDNGTGGPVWTHGSFTPPTKPSAHSWRGLFAVGWWHVVFAFFRTLVLKLWASYLSLRSFPNFFEKIPSSPKIYRVILLFILLGIRSRYPFKTS